MITLHHLHSLNIAHRDIKLSNILISDQTTSSTLYLLADFGLSTFCPPCPIYKRPLLTSQTHQNIYERCLSGKCGTPGQVAPEVLRGENYSQKCDIFSVGCLAFNLVCNKSMFAEESLEEKIKKNTECNLEHIWE